MKIHLLPKTYHIAKFSRLSQRLFLTFASLGAHSLSWSAFPLLVRVPSLGQRSLASYADAGSDRLRLSSSRGRTACVLRRRGVAPLLTFTEKLWVCASPFKGIKKENIPSCQASCFS